MFYIKENGPVTFSRAIPYRNTVVSEEREYFAATTFILKWPTRALFRKNEEVDYFVGHEMVIAFIID